MSDLRLLTSQETASYLRLSCETVRNLALAGELPGVKIGRTWRFSRAALENFLARTGRQITQVAEDDKPAPTASQSCAEQRRNDSTEDPMVVSTGPRIRGEPFDATALLQRCFGNLEFANVLLDELQSTWRPLAGEIRLLAEKGDFAALASTSHSLKSAAGIVCAERVRSLALAIEQAGRSMDSGTIPSLVAELAAEIDRCVEELPQLRNSLKETPNP